MDEINHWQWLRCAWIKAQSQRPLRAVECPSDIIDAIGGWATKGIGHAYGKGYGLEILAKWMKLL